MGHSSSEIPSFLYELPRRALLCAVHLPEDDDLSFRESLAELRRLATTLGMRVEGEITQKRSSFDASAYLGPGKLEELSQLCKQSEAPTAILLDHEVSPSQARNVQKATGAALTLDRTAVILEIFHRHAKSGQARAQVELVRLEYMAPRLRETQGLSDRVRGGIGGKGAGETQLELDRRRLRDRIAELRDELVALEREHKTRSARRQGMRRVALCGYTNAGKSTLFRALTGADVYVADKLFATLDTTVRQLHPEPRRPILMSDTVGFIRNLPTKLVASFKTTLDEALEAGLILHVVDASDPAAMRHVETTCGVLAEIGAAEVPQILVFNKTDKLDGGKVPEEWLARFARHASISAKDAQDVARLRQLVIDFFDEGLTETEIEVPYDQPQLRAQYFAQADVLDEQFGEQSARLRVRADEATLGRLAHIVHEREPRKE
ncbi:MAG TPA: GTPase HflX [Pseudomonadota bacterium]|nr:GTPase HflX [Pseudomonadota bacterium]